MGRWTQRLSRGLTLFGIDPRRLGRALRGLGPYRANRRALRGQLARDPDLARAFPFGKAYPCLEDRFLESGRARGDYFHQDLLVAQLIHRNNPPTHADVGSRIDGFVAHVASFRPIVVYDIRELRTTAANITFVRRDIMRDAAEIEGTCDSLSCLHVLEHFGLGRYGDPVDAAGHLKGWETLHRMLRPGGKLYFSTPIGPQRIEFDAHRVFSMPYLLGLIDGKYRIDSFHYVTDPPGELVRDADPRSQEASRNFGCRFGCAIFELTKT